MQKRRTARRKTQPIQSPWLTDVLQQNSARRLSRRKRLTSSPEAKLLIRELLKRSELSVATKAQTGKLYLTRFRRVLELIRYHTHELNERGIAYLKREQHLRYRDCVSAGQGIPADNALKYHNDLMED